MPPATSVNKRRWGGQASTVQAPGRPPWWARRHPGRAQLAHRQAPSQCSQLQRHPEAARGGAHDRGLGSRGVHQRDEFSGPRLCVSPCQETNDKFLSLSCQVFLPLSSNLSVFLTTWSLFQVSSISWFLPSLLQGWDAMFQAIVLNFVRRVKLPSPHLCCAFFFFQWTWDTQCDGAGTPRGALCRAVLSTCSPCLPLSPIPHPVSLSLSPPSLVLSH